MSAGRGAADAPPVGLQAGVFALLTAEELFFEAFVEHARLLRSSALVAELIGAAESLVESHVGSGPDPQKVIDVCRSRAWRRFVRHN